MKNCNFLFVLLLIFAFVSCSEDNIIEKTANVDDVSISKKEELVRYSAAYPNLINYKVARYLAYQELANGTNQLIKLPVEYELSEIPNVIYDYDNLPKYYEYEVIANGDVIATITTYAQKEDNCVIAYIFSGKRTTEKSDKDAFVGEYPAVYYGVKQVPGTIVQNFTDAEDRTVNISQSVMCAPQNDDPWAGYYAMANDMDEENRQATLATIEEMKQSPEYQELIKNETAINEYWTEVDLFTEEITAMSDKDINRSFTQNSSVRLLSTNDDKDPNGINGYPSSYYVIPRYDNDNLKRTSWYTYCGPGALAWIFRGLYDSYPISGPTSKYIAIHPLQTEQYYYDVKGNLCLYNAYSAPGNYSYYYCLDDDELQRIWNRDPDNLSRQVDNGFLEEIYSHTVKTGNDYPMYHLGLANAMKSITNGQYGVQSTTESHSHIKNKHLPILICYVPAGAGGASHYMVGFGSGKIGTKKYVYVMDNTNKIQDFGYKAYWRKETTGNYGLRYKIVKK